MKLDWVSGLCVLMVLGSTVGMSYYGPRQKKQKETSAALAECQGEVAIRNVALGVMAAGNARLEADVAECEDSLDAHINANRLGEDELP